MTALRLGVNVDHVATLRQARKDIDPDPIAAAQVARQSGADIIVCHLRRDRRHIQDDDLIKLCRLKGETHVELADDAKIVEIVASRSSLGEASRGSHMSTSSRALIRSGCRCASTRAARPYSATWSVAELKSS